MSFDRSVHELIAETRFMRGESEELRRASKVLAQEIKKRERDEEASSAGRVAASPPLVANPVEDSIYSVSIERELSGLARVQPSVQPSFFQGR